MKARACFAVLLAVAFFLPRALAGDDKPDIDRLAQPLVDSGTLASIVIATLDDGKAQVYGYGKARASDTAPPDGQTIYEIGSVSKVFTSLILARLVEEKVVKLEDAARPLFPGLDERDAPFPDEKNDPHPITLLDLATHHAGLPHDLPRKATDAKPFEGYTEAELFRYFTENGFYKKARETSFAYSNLGVGTLGFILAKKTKSTYEDLLKSKVGSPLELASTGIELTDAQKARFAEGHDADGDTAGPLDLGVLAGCGGIRSNADDLVKFLRAQINPQKTDFAAAIELQQTAQRDVDEQGNKIGLGWIIDNHGLRWHNGQTTGFHSYVAFDKRNKRGVVVLASNASPIVDELGAKVLRVLTGEQPPPIKLPPADFKVAPAKLDRLVGDYALAPSFHIYVSCDGEKLYARATNQLRLRIHARSETEFVYRAVDARISFKVDATGRVESLTLHQNGRDMPAPRERIYR